MTNQRSELKPCPLMKNDGGTIAFGRMYECIRACPNRTQPEAGALREALEKIVNCCKNDPFVGWAVIAIRAGEIAKAALSPHEGKEGGA